MSSLNPKTLCRLKTVEQIEAKITYYEDALDGAIVESYDKDTTQGRQKVVSAQIDKIESILQAYYKALECKSGLGGVQIVSHNFRTNNSGGII